MMAQNNRGAHAPGVKMTLWRALQADALHLRRSPLVPLHLACALVAGAACGLYFAFAPWDASMGTDAFVQLLGSMMPFMVGIVCGLDASAEDEATGYANLLSTPSRSMALTARLVALWLMGAAALAIAVAVFALPLALVGRQALAPIDLMCAVVGLAFGSAPLYLILFAIALRWGRNAAITVGAAGLMLALFSLGGLAHGLMTGALTAMDANAFSYLPTSWAALLGSLAIELAIANGPSGHVGVAARIVSSMLSAAGLCAFVTVLLSCVSAVWIARFEPMRREE